MNPAQVVLSQLVKAALVAAFVGLLVRGKHRQCWSFPIYLLLVLGCDTLVSLWPERFYVRWFWYLQQGLWDLAKLAVALEIGYRAFLSFPGVRPLAQGVVATILLGTTCTVIWLPVWSRLHESAMFEWQPRVLTGTIWLMTALALLIVYYRIPIRPMQRAILLGFVPYLVIFVTVLNLMRSHGWEIRPWAGVADATAYLALVLWWAYEAWKPNPPADVDRAVLRRLGWEQA